ncbi:MAG TPA: hypothetical protein VM869_08875, partial [Enhygromyxa sp.]|nr:hypothetical protein [Enhygromyxa sp.]
MRRLGDGAEGGVWIANDAGGRSVVLKHVARERRSTVARAFELLRSISSPHLPAALELIDDAEGGVWLVTGHVEGTALGPGPVPLQQALAEALGVAHALAAIHALGTHHGDVSANNVIVTPTRGIVLTDLGQLGSQGCGTPGFLAPEVLAGEGGPAADRFGVGSLLCLRLFGQVPWRRPEVLLALDRAAVRRRIRALAEAAEVDCPAPVAALLERLLDPDPAQRVGDPAMLVSRLRVLHRASGDGESLRARSAWWLPNRWSFVGPHESLLAAARSLASGARLIAVAGPVGSGRGRIVEELVALLQLARARTPEQAVVARQTDPDALARELGGSGDWLEAWVGDGRCNAAVARAWGCVEAPAWPRRLVGAIELQAAVLRAGAGLGEDALILPVELELGRALADAGPDVRVLEVQRWGLEEVRGCLLEVVEERPAEPDLERWAAAIHEASGGWPAKVVRAIEAYARTGGDDPDRAAIERALIAADSEPRLDAQTARRVLDRRWGLPAELPPSLHDDGQRFVQRHARPGASRGPADPVGAGARRRRARRDRG